MTTPRQRVLELVRYAIVGGFNTATYFGLYSGGIVIGVPYPIAVVVAFTISASIGYWLHEHWTFGGASPSLAGLGKWIAAQGTSIALNLGLLAILVDGFGLHEILAQLLILPVMPLATYLVGRRWVFTRAPARERQPAA